MKHLKHLLISTCLLFAASAFGQTTVSTTTPYVIYAGTGTALGGTNAFAVVSANSRNNGTPLVTYLSVTSDTSVTKARFYTVTGYADIQATNSGTTLYVNTNLFMTANTVCVLRHMTGDTYEKIVAASVANTNQLTSAYAPVTAAIPGDRLYALALAGYIPVGSSTLSLTGSGIFSGQPGMPLCVDITGTSACSVNALCASYQ